MTDSGVSDHSPCESDTQASNFSDIFAQIESRLGFDPSHARTGIHDPSVRVAAISTLNKAIDATKQFLHALIIRRNSLLPISILPPEILARVFHLLVLDELPFSGRRNLGWIGVTHVCRHWRQVALDDSSLWARIRGIPISTNWILEMLVRAKNAPLDIEFNLNYVARPSPEALLIILPHLSHTRQLRFHNLSRLHSDNVLQICSSEAPSLEHFELAATACYPTTFQDLGGNMLFSGHAPRLQTLSLSQVVIPWSLIPRGQLTQLKITCFKEDVHFPADLNGLIDLLVNCPALEILVLDSCLPFQLIEFPRGHTIHLPHLSRLRLCGSTSRIMNMLNMLKLPSSTTFHFDCISTITSIPLLPVISAQFRTPTPVEFKSLAVTIGCHSLSIIASTTPSTWRNRQTQNVEDDIVGNAELVLSLDGLLWPGHLTDLLEQACKMLPISNLEFISMSATDTIDINWAKLFGSCPNVTTMHANGHGTSDLVRALTAPTVTDAGSSKEAQKHNNGESTLSQPTSTVAHAHAHAALFPKLKYLALANLTFAVGNHFSDILFDVFERGLQQRMAASGAPLTLLRISDCNISDDHAYSLQKLVQDFHLDENGSSTSGFDDFDDYEQRILDDSDPYGEEDDSVGHGTASDWDSEEWEQRDDDSERSY